MSTEVYTLLIPLICIQAILSISSLVLDRKPSIEAIITYQLGSLITLFLILSYTNC